MNHVNKTVTYLLDAASGSTFIIGFIQGQNLLMILGGLASLAAIVNHADQFLKRNKKKK